jgi:hypothetical protein
MHLVLPLPRHRDNFAGGFWLRILHRKSWIPDKGWASGWRYGKGPIVSLQERPKMPESTEHEWNEQGSGVGCVLLVGENIKNSIFLLVLSNEVGLEVHGQKTKYIFTSFNRDVPKS